MSLALIPRVGPHPPEDGSRSVLSLVGALRAPAVYLAVVVVYFTYAADILARGELPTAAVPALYAAIGLSGIVGVATGGAVQGVGAVQVAALCLLTVGAALALLGLAGSSIPATAASAVIFGAAHMAGSAVLAVWTAERVPGRAGAAFTLCLVIGATSSAAAPAVAGMLIPRLGLGPLFTLTAAVSLVGGTALLLPDALRGRRAGPVR